MCFKTVRKFWRDYQVYLCVVCAVLVELIFLQPYKQRNQGSSSSINTDKRGNTGNTDNYWETLAVGCTIWIWIFILLRRCIRAAFNIVVRRPAAPPEQTT